MSPHYFNQPFREIRLVKSLKLLHAAVAILLVFCGFLVVAQAGTTITTPYAGMTRYSADNVTVNGRSVDYEIVVLDVLDNNMSFYLTPSNGAAPYETTRQTTKNFATAYTTELAINTHFFDTSLLPETTVTGIAASNGDVYSPFESVGGLAALNISVENFPETVTGVSGGTTFASSPSVPYTAIATGSMLRREGVVVNVGAEDYRARTQIGVTRSGDKMMFFASSSGMTEQEGAEILATQFGAFNVHGMDGGGSTTMVLRTGTSSQSIIAIESGGERAVGANLGVQAGPYVAGIPDAMTWDANPGTTGIQQGAGTWDFVTNNWQSAGANRTWVNPKTPILGAGGGAAIALGGHVAVTNLTVDGGYTIGSVGGSPMTLLGDVTTSGAAPTTINAPLGNSTTFTKKGAQTLALGSASRISMLNMNEGTIDLGGQTLTIIDPLVPMTLNGGTIQNGNITLSDSAPEFAVPSGNTILNVNFTAPKITKTGEGAVTLGGTVAWTGGLTISAGTLRLSAAGTLPATAVTITSGLLDLNGGTGSIPSLLLGGVEAVTTGVATGAGTLTLAGNVTYDATNHPLGATISGQLALNANRSLIVNDSNNAADDLTVSAIISGAFTLSKSGEGTLVLSGANTVAALTVNDGVVRSGAPDTLPNGTLTIVKGLVDLAGFNDTVGAIKPGGVAGETPEIRTGNGMLTMGGDYTYSATNNGLGALIKGHLHLGNATRKFIIANSVNAPVDTKIEADIQGSSAVGLTKEGAGNLEIEGALTFPGLLTVNNGVLLLSGNDSTLGAITLGGVAGVSAVLDTGTTTLSQTGTLAYSSGNNGLGSTLKGRLDIGSTLRTFTINNSTNAAVDMRIEAEITGSGGFTKGGPGTLELAGANTLTGPITITAGVLRLSHANALGFASALTFTGSTTVDVTGLADPTLYLNSSALTLSGVGSVSGNVNMSAGKIVSAGGTFSITGTLTTSGGTTEITVGTSPGNIAVAGNATLGGTLKVTMNGTALSGTQTKVLITAASISGNYSSIILPNAPNGTGYTVAIQGNQLVLLVAPFAGSIPVVTAGQNTAGTISAPFTYQILASNSPTSYTLASGVLPAGVTLNTSTGVISGTPGVTGTFTPSFTASNPGGTSSSQSLTITIHPPAPIVTAGQTASGINGSAFNYQISASNSPTSYALASGSLPANVTLNTATGLLGGTPGETGTFTPSFTATNGSGTSAAQSISITIHPPPPVISTGQNATGTNGVLFNYQIVASNSPTSYALSSGSLPSGVTLDAGTGFLSGTPSETGTFTPSFTATNAGGTSQGQSMTITINTPFETWLLAKGLSIETSPNNDSDADGWTIIEEYVLGGDPFAADAGLTDSFLSGANLQILFSLNVSATDVVIEVQASPGLSSWTTILTKTNGGAWSGPAPYVQGATVVGLGPVTVNDTISGAGARFLRLKITRP